MKMTNELWERWIDNWKWINDVAEKRNWNIIDRLEIGPPIGQIELGQIEKEIGTKLPPSYVDVVTNYSRAVTFYIDIEGEEPEGEFNPLFSIGYEGLWSVEDLPVMKISYDNWVKECFPDADNDYDRVWHNKIPFISVATGDLIAFDVSVNTDEFPVVFLSHDGSEFHGKRLGYNFTDFMTRWSNIGCFGPEDWQLEVFHDTNENVLLLDGDKVERWKAWLNS